MRAIARRRPLPVGVLAELRPLRVRSSNSLAINQSCRLLAPSFIFLVDLHSSSNILLSSSEILELQAIQEFVI